MRALEACSSFSKQDLTMQLKLLTKTKSIPARYNKLHLAQMVIVCRWLNCISRVYHKHKTQKAKRLLLRFVQRWKRLKPQNNECPITLEKLTNPIFHHVTDKGFVRGYSLQPLAEYIVSCGQALDPVTRVPYTPIELKRMDKQLKANKMKIKSVYAAVYSSESKAEHKAQMEYDLHVSFLEWCVYDAFSETLNALHTPQQHMQLSSFKDLVFQLALKDAHRAVFVLDILLQEPLHLNEHISPSTAEDMHDIVHTLSEAVKAAFLGMPLHLVAQPVPQAAPLQSYLANHPIPANDLYDELDAPVAGIAVFVPYFDDD